MSPKLAKRSDLRLGKLSTRALSSVEKGHSDDMFKPVESEDMPWNTLRRQINDVSKYHFSDLSGDNLATSGYACQSSTRFGAFAKRAIDGRKDPFFSHGSVSHTGSGITDPTPWWQVSLVRPSIIGTIRIWARDPEETIAEVI